MFVLLLLLTPSVGISTVPGTPLTYLPDDPDLRCFARACSAAPLSPRLEKVHATLMRCGLNGHAARLKLRSCTQGVDDAEWQRDRMRRDRGARTAAEREVALTSLVAQAQRQAVLKRPTALAIAPPPSSASAAVRAQPLLRRLPTLRLRAGAWRDRMVQHRTHWSTPSPPTPSPPTPSSPMLSPPAPSPPTPSPSLWVMAKAAQARQRAADKDRSTALPPPPPPRPAPAQVASPEAAEHTNGRAAAHSVRTAGSSPRRLLSSANDVRPALFGGLCVLAVGALVL